MRTLRCSPLLDQGQPLQQLRLAGEADAQGAQEAGIDLVDDLQLARQQLLEQLQPPGLQGLGQQGVVGVADRGGGDAPGGVPVDAVDIDQQPHQLRHGDRRVGVVELHRELAVELGDRDPLAGQDAEHVLQGAGDEEDLLAEPQALALLQLIVGIEHLGEGFRLHLVQHGPGVVAGIEGGEVEGVRRLGRPQPQGVGGVDAVAQDRGVVGDADHGLAADQHRIAPFRADHLPGVAAGQPGIGALHLAVGADLLAEDAELVADAVADGRQLEGGHRLLETGRQPAQAAIAQAGFRLLRQHLLEGEAEGLAGGRGLLPQPEAHQVVLQVGPQQEFRRHVGGGADVLAGVGVGRVHPAGQQDVPDRQRQADVVVVGGGEGGGFRLAGEQMAPHRLQEGLALGRARGGCGAGHGDGRRSAEWTSPGLGSTAAADASATSGRTLRVTSLPLASLQPCSTSCQAEPIGVGSSSSASMFHSSSLSTPVGPEKLPFTAAVSVGLEEVARVM
jgi:hypothetical protein